MAITSDEYIVPIFRSVDQGTAVTAAVGDALELLDTITAVIRILGFFRYYQVLNLNPPEPKTATLEAAMGNRKSDCCHVQDI